MAEEKYKPPKKTTGDLAHVTAKAVLSAVPHVGGPAAELFQYLLQPPLEKRREKWMDEVAEGLRELEATGLNLEDLRDNEQFISIVMQASQVVLRTHQEEKRRALKNAVLNVANGQGPDDALQQVFLGYIDTLTELHLRILKFFQTPAVADNLGMGGLSHVLEGGFPELRDRREIYDSLWRDLYLRGLVNTEQLHVTMTGQGLRQKRTTGLGDIFLAFISEPR